jgi:asparagine synthase (glutamine-hydrolysing)
MSRFVALVDWAENGDLAARLDAAERALSAGGSHECRERVLRAPLGLLLLSGQCDGPSWAEDEGSLFFMGGFGPGSAERSGVLAQCREAIGATEPAMPPGSPAGPAGRRIFARWDGAARELLLVTEPNGQRPVFFWHSQDTLVVASEPKGIWAAVAAARKVDADGLVQMWTLGHCIGSQTLLCGVKSAEPGAVYRFSRSGVDVRTGPAPMFSEARGANVETLAGRINHALLDVLEAYRPRFRRTSVALSGGMDSRYVLAGALRAFEEVDTFTFGEPASWDAQAGRTIARLAGVSNAWHDPRPDFLARWAAYAVWRTDGLLSCVHAHGMDATIAHGRHAAVILNGVGGDFLMGAFLRPSHLLQPADPLRATRIVLAKRRFHAHPLSAILKPEVLDRASAPVEAELRGLFARYRFRRLGNLLLSYWLRHYAPRITAMGLILEEPWVEHVGPLVDPAFIRSVCDIPLEHRFTGQVYRRCLALLAPALCRVRWGRTGVAPRWPWPFHVLSRYGLSLGLLPPRRPAVDYAARLRGALAPWVRDTLLSPRTLADGYLQPSYLREAVESHLSGGADRTGELSMALTVELWRRMFIEGEGFPTALPDDRDAGVVLSAAPGAPRR